MSIGWVTYIESGKTLRDQIHIFAARTCSTERTRKMPATVRWPNLQPVLSQRQRPKADRNTLKKCTSDPRQCRRSIEAWKRKRARSPDISSFTALVLSFLISATSSLATSGNMWQDVATIQSHGSKICLTMGHKSSAKAASSAVGLGGAWIVCVPNLGQSTVGKEWCFLQCTKHDTCIIHKEVKHILAAEARLNEPLKLLAECVCVCVHRIRWGAKSWPSV